ncbi:MAG: hypothetical protein U9O66_01380 [Patescibacteria group bacterium]|nr:hypothetical protein [Patescibacteria group bacterium]
MEETIQSIEEQNEQIRAQNRGIMNFAYAMILVCVGVIAGGAVCAVL